MRSSCRSHYIPGCHFCEKGNEFAGMPVEDLASDIAVIFADEIYILSKCREQTDFLNTHVYVINGTDPQVETVPAIILEKVLGHDILSPWNQFPQ